MYIYIYINRKQNIIVHGKQSSLIDVVSGVPQCTVKAKYLGLTFNNNLEWSKYYNNDKQS